MSASKELFEKKSDEKNEALDKRYRELGLSTCKEPMHTMNLFVLGSCGSCGEQLLNAKTI